MKKNITIAIILFISHTIEEAFSLFWLTDNAIRVLSKNMSLSPVVIYWLVQLVLYVFLFIVLQFSTKKFKSITYSLLGIILLFEFHHPWKALSLGTYTPGLYSGLFLGLFGIYFWAIFIKLLIKNYDKQNI